MKLFLPLQAAVALSLGMAAMAGSHQADVVVYGDASGGVTGAVQAARMGKSTVLVSQYGHLGGMTSSGLGLTDIGNDRILGGLSREFYHRLYQHYQKPGSWIQEKLGDFTNVGQGLPALNEKTELASTFEPKVAEAVFDAMVKEAGVKVVKGRLDLKNGVVKSDKRITALRLEDGTEIKGRMFIDAPMRATCCLARACRLSPAASRMPSSANKATATPESPRKTNCPTASILMRSREIPPAGCSPA